VHYIRSVELHIVTNRMEAGHLTIRIDSVIVVLEHRMPCLEMKELEAICSRYEERRRVAISPSSERRYMPFGKYRAGQARIAYLIRLHRQSCAACSQAE
jgi:hypothetical protein